MKISNIKILYKILSCLVLLGSETVKRMVKGILAAEGGKLMSWVELQSTLKDGA